jgi:dTDP-4-amino-4,6-dideoxygalactose transaminase
VLALLGGPPIRKDPWPRWPEHGPAELDALARVLESGTWGGYPAPGREASHFARAWGEYLGSRHVVLAANGTVTLEVILRAIGIQAGDVVIVPALTWIATASAPAYLNAVPVFADVDRETLCIDPRSIEALITPRTRAIIPVHLGSAMADMDRISELAATHGLRVIEDCAHAHGARWKDRAAGTIGDAGSFSFQSSKLMTAGEGGAICTDSEDVAQRCQSLVNCGRKEPGYGDFDGPNLGWNYRLTELQAALLSAQLVRLPEQKERRARNLKYFERRLAELQVGLVLQKRDERMSASSAYQIVLLYDAEQWNGLPRDRFVAALEAEGVPADGAFYVPIQDRIAELFPLRAAEYPMIRERYGDALSPEHVSTPVAREAAYQRTIWLHHALFLGAETEIDDVLAAILKIRGEIDALL